MRERLRRCSCFTQEIYFVESKVYRRVTGSSIIIPLRSLAFRIPDEKGSYYCYRCYRIVCEREHGLKAITVYESPHDRRKYCPCILHGRIIYPVDHRAVSGRSLAHDEHFRNREADGLDEADEPECNPESPAEGHFLQGENNQATENAGGDDDPGAADTVGYPAA